MPYEFREDGVTADATILAQGRALDELFVAAADATANLMVASLDSIRPAVARHLLIEAGSLDILLMKLLEEQIFYKDAEGLILRLSEPSVSQTEGGYRLAGILWGETLDPSRHELGVDVKAVTLHRLTVQPIDGGWRAEVTVDI